MIHDAKYVMSEDQAIASTSDTACTRPIDLHGGLTKNEWGTAIDKEIGEGGKVWLNVKVTEKFTSNGAGTLDAKFEHSDDDSSYSSVLSSGALAKTTLVAGYNIHRVAVPANSLKRYVRMNYTVATAAMTAGKITATIDKNPGQN
jgi:hypothetical protein